MLLLALLRAAPLGHTETVISSKPCDDNKPGDNTVRDGTFDFRGFFNPEHRSMYEKIGYVQLKNLVDRDAVLTFWENHFKDIDHLKVGHESQPRRLKINIEGDTMKDARKVFQPAFFVAHQMLVTMHRNFHGDGPVPYNRSIDWIEKIKADFNFVMHSHNNAALPGSVYQNAHWDVPNSKSQGMVLVDIPLVDVGPCTAPLEIWKGTHTTDYRRIFDEPGIILQESNTQRQYWSCSKEMQEAAMSRPNAQILSSIGMKYDGLGSLPMVGIASTNQPINQSISRQAPLSVFSFVNPQIHSLCPSQPGDATVRTPATWHRGTPNNSSRTRDMMTFLIQPSKKKGG